MSDYRKFAATLAQEFTEGKHELVRQTILQLEEKVASCYLAALVARTLDGKDSVDFINFMTPRGVA